MPSNCITYFKKKKYAEIRKNMQIFRTKIKLEYKIEKSSLNSKQKGSYKVKRKENWRPGVEDIKYKQEI